MNSAIVVEKLTKTYGHLAAVEGVSLEQKAGEIFRQNGPKAAGIT